MGDTGEIGQIVVKGECGSRITSPNHSIGSKVCREDITRFELTAIIAIPRPYPSNRFNINRGVVCVLISRFIRGCQVRDIL